SRPLDGHQYIEVEMRWRGEIRNYSRDACVALIRQLQRSAKYIFGAKKIAGSASGEHDGTGVSQGTSCIACQPLKIEDLKEVGIDHGRTTIQGRAIPVLQPGAPIHESSRGFYFRVFATHQ